MIRTCLVALLIVLAAVSCSERPPVTPNAVGVWQNTTQWENNLITLTIRPDSMMLFKVEKSFCPGTKFFVSVGKWHVEQDSILVMEQYTDGRHFELSELFPELVQTQKDSMNVISLEVTAKLIIANDVIYDLQSDGKRSPDRIYKKISEIE
ncbi:MAG TPA: hypothetical protein VK826_01290 [Bacteroidia bacterium]|nr:hypothetical protein [Bacteroidia bacterium]